MTDTKKKELFPYFAYSYSKEHQPNKYGGDMSFEMWYKAIQEDAPFLEQITEAALSLEEDAWDKLEKDYSVPEEGIQSAKKGAKLDNLKKLRSAKKTVGKKAISTCSCGCDLVAAKEDGGAIGRGRGRRKGIGRKSACPCCGR